MIDEGFIVAPIATGEPATDWTNLDAFFRDVETTGRIGIIPSGTYVIDQTLLLPFRGRVEGSGIGSALARGATTIRASGSFDVLQLWDNHAFKGPFGRLELSNVCLRGTLPTTRGAAIRIFYWTSMGRRDDYFHDIVVEQTWAGIHAQPGVPPALLHSAPIAVDSSANGLIFERIILRTRGYALVLKRSVACRLVDVGSDHANDPQDPSQEADMLFEGVPGDGGIVLDKVGSAGASTNGVVIRNFLQVWGHHVNADEPLLRGLWVVGCKEVYLNHCFTSLAGYRPTGNNAAGYCAVIENPAFGEGRVNLDSCFFGDGITNGLLLKRLQSVSITNGVFIASGVASLHVTECENLSVVGALFRGERTVSGPSTEAIRVEHSLFCEISNCQFSQFVNGRDVIHVSSANNVTISGNCLRGPGSQPAGIAVPIRVGQSQYTTIVGNQVSGYDRAIDLLLCTDAVISANALRGLSLSGSHPGILVQDSAGCMVTGNRVNLFSVGIEELGSTSRVHHNGYVGNNLSTNGIAMSVFGPNGVNQGNVA